MKKYTVSAKNSDNQGKWYVIDAENAVLGRLASKVATHLRGKNNPAFTPHVDTGDAVVVINAEKVVLTGRKWDQKVYHRHSGYIGEIERKAPRRPGPVRGQGHAAQKSAGPEVVQKAQSLCRKRASARGPAARIPVMDGIAAQPLFV